LNISSEALAGTRARGKTRADDFQIGQDLLLRFLSLLRIYNLLWSRESQCEINTLY